MSKYIDQSKVNDEIVRVLEHTDCKDEYIDRVLRAIENLPTINIVRCKNCIRAKSWQCPFYRAGYTYKADDYCSDGERSRQ